MQGWGWEKVHHPDHIKKLVEFVKEAWKKDEAFEQTFPLRRHDGEYRWFITRAYPVKDANGNIERWIGTNTDIHEQKITEQKKDEFISVASHEMKTPLTTAKGYIQLLLLSLSEENQTALYATKVNQAIEKLNELATELLDASKIQNGQLDYNITSFDLNEMVEETIENIQHSTNTHGIQKTGNCSQQITGDRNRLQQVLINFLTNAIKYSPEADKVIVKIDEQDEKIQVSVQDFGVGMSGKHLNKIFDRYYRVEEHSSHFQGLGLGLYISYNIIERHNGTIWAESEPENGSIFHFSLPL
jgi:signal transduction histidine kinase